MLDIRHLEQQWFRYKLKRYIPFTAALLAIVLTLTVALLFFFNHNTLDDSSVPSNVTPQENIHVTTSSPVTPSTPSQPQVIEKAAELSPTPVQTSQSNTAATTSYQPKKLEPSYDFLNKISYETEAKRTVPPKPKKQPQPTPKPQRQQLNTNIAPAVEKKIDTILQPAPSTPTVSTVTSSAKSSPAVPKGIKISRIKSQGEIQDIIHRFKANKSPVLGLYLARYYYKMQNYEKAYNYALSTNNIDPNIEESWLIFASSQMKLSKKSQAIKTLKAYIRNSGSLNARSLLHSIQNGAFK